MLRRLDTLGALAVEGGGGELPRLYRGVEPLDGDGMLPQVLRRLVASFALAEHSSILRAARVGKPLIYASVRSVDSGGGTSLQMVSSPFKYRHFVSDPWIAADHQYV